jgi:hypothetical protein
MHACRNNCLLLWQVACAGDTWRRQPGALQQSRWEAPVLACLEGLVRRGQTLAKARSSSISSSWGSMALRCVLAGLRQLTAAVPASAWAPAWAQACSLSLMLQGTAPLQNCQTMCFALELQHHPVWAS